MTEIELLVDLTKHLNRQGPGSEADTLKALSFLRLPENDQLKIADIGCGTGEQSITLAKRLHGNIVAVDLFPQFLEILEARKKQKNIKASISTLHASMSQLPFQENSLDLIWSEGAIYNMGFEEGIKYWKQFLKKQGYLVLSEITWITLNRPKEIEDFWVAEYPQIATASYKIRQLEKQGFSLCGYFFLPQTSWTHEYYTPLQNEFNSFLKRHHNSILAQEVVKQNQAEIDLYVKYKSYLSYGFYITQLNG